MLSDEDSDLDFYLAFFEEALQYCPANYAVQVKNNITRLQSINQSTGRGQWNREEMWYYDAKVDSKGKREQFLATIKAEPLWHIYLERERHLVKKIDRNLSGSTVLEVGCGNARTLSWIFRPQNHGFDYVGSDISFDRLILAKMVVPEGDFVQCSALNLPFKDKSFLAVFAFGVLHHLPDPLQGISSCLLKTSKEGYFIFHEPINKPKKFFADGRFRALRERLETYEHSEHDNELDWNSSLEYLRKKLLGVKFSVTVLRTVGAFFLSKSPYLCRNKFLWRIIIGLDNFFLNTFCRTPNILGPGGVLVVAQKVK